MRLIDADVVKTVDYSCLVYIAPNDYQGIADYFYKQLITNQPTAYDVELEIRLLKNYLSNMPKVYGFRNQNWVVVRDLLMSGTSHAGMTSCIAKCRELGIDPYGYQGKGAVKDE